MDYSGTGNNRPRSTAGVHTANPAGGSPGISQETVAGLGPYLEDLTAAQTSEEIQQALQAIGEFIETLPEDQGTLLTSLFTDVFGPNSLFADMSQDLQQGNDYQAEISNNTSELVSVTNEVNDGIRDSKARLDDLWETALSSNDYLAEIAASSSQSASNTEAVNFGEQATQALAEVGAVWLRRWPQRWRLPRT